ncbi:MAG: DNA gyrase/topoisomerase IV subunit A [Coraliomargaritaceae bacterium]|tara:strand:+ start:7642 stop:9690 length:2049 start_codon:yes stop_codon:yes gene_type:complete
MSKNTPSDNNNLELNLSNEANDNPIDDNENLIDNVKANHLDSYYSKWFLEYASYVILERAVPHALDGLKPVQRRILHSLKELDDGRYNKVANVIGNTMKYHPHGDASIGDAMVQVGQKEILLDTQGNWGNTFTGDSAAAPRYIEVRLSKFALEVAFNSKTTNWLASYDGRSKEPEILPIKFPLLLAQGAEGIAVGLSCKILPHNFNELIDASIAALRKQTFELYPDFITGGTADISEYNDGKRGGKVKVRAKIEKRKNNLLAISELPYGKTTTSLIDSILSANDKGKIKISRVEDNTSDHVEILVYLSPGSDSEQITQALYAFTDCELSISSNICVILDDKPKFLTATELLKISANRTKELLKEEFEIQLLELQEKWHLSSLEKIFIEEKIYRKIETITTWEGVIETVEKSLKPFAKKLNRAITRDDILKLLEIKIKRISKFDSLKADELLKDLEDKIALTENNLKQLTRCAIRWYKELKAQYGKQFERKTQLESFEKVIAEEVVISNETLYVNRDEGFAGYSMKKDESVCKCSKLSDVLSINQEGILMVKKISEKAYFGKKILYIDLFNRKNPNDKNYCIIYRSGKSGPVLAKHFSIGGVTRDKEYDLTKGVKGSKIFYIAEYESENGNPPSVKINLKPSPRLRKLEIIVDFTEQALRGRNSGGNIITKNSIRNVVRNPKS